MLLIDNINILKTSNLQIWEKLNQYDHKENIVISKIGETKRGGKTLVITKDNKTTYLHSKYNPLREAETIVETYKDIKEDTSILFYGTGLGYHIKLLLEKHPKVKYYIYEPVPELMYHFLSNINLKELQTNRCMGMDVGLDIMSQKMNRFIDTSKDKLIIVELPSHKQNFVEEYKEFNKIFLNSIQDKRIQISANYLFQKRWLINSMKNFSDVLTTPNILIEKKNKFKNKPAIIVAAGPSLNYEIESLKYIKENKLAYIFSVGSALNTLIHHGIYPDAACTYDPSVHNQKVFKTTKEKGIKEIPMIFGSSVGYETLLDYPGDKYHMITSQDTVSSYYLKNEDNRVINIVQDAPTIAVVTMQLLYDLGFGLIILVGQNLGYVGKERHSEGISYSRKTTDKEIENGIWIEDVYGNEVLTNEGFNTMRSQMEQYIGNWPNLTVINTTKGGAHIAGTKFIELKEVIDKKLETKVVKERWLEGDKTNYSKEYLKSQSDKMDIAYKQVLKIIKEYYGILDRIDKAINNRNFNQAEDMYIKLDKELKNIEGNDYYKTFVLPMNRVQYKILVDSIDHLNDEKDLYQKGKKIVYSFRQFMDGCNKDMQEIKPIYDDMRENIKKICNMNSEG